MANINWKVRLKSKQFWIGCVGAIGTCITAIVRALGGTFDANEFTTAGTAVVTVVFTILSLVGIVADPTTQGIGDSAQAMTYTSPKPKESE